MSPSATIAPIHEVSVAQVVRGIPPGSTAVPQSVVERGAAPTRAFLSGALLESHRFSSSSKAVDVLLALLVHVVVLGGPILAGLYYMETINLKEFTTTFLVAPLPPPPPPPAPVAGVIKPQTSRHVFMSAGKLLAPTYISKQVAQIKEAPIESEGLWRRSGRCTRRPAGWRDWWGPEYGCKGNCSTNGEIKRASACRWACAAAESDRAGSPRVPATRATSAYSGRGEDRRNLG